MLTFTFERCAPEDIEIPETTDSIDTAFLAGKRILLVDDNTLNIEIAQDMFEDLDLVVETDTNGRSAVEKISEADPGYYDYVFMDVQMPMMDGYEATETIRKLESEWTKTLPIFAMTANAFEEDRRNALAAGMNEHLVKPIDIQAVIRAMNRYRK